MRPSWISETLKFRSSRLRVKAVKLRFGKARIVQWYYADLPDGVAVLPLDRDKTVYLVQEWRPAWRREVLQVPAGASARKTEKALLTQVHEELREEVGLDAKRIIKLGSYLAAASVRFRPHLYLATHLFNSALQRDPSERIRIVRMPFVKAYDLFVAGKIITTSHTLIAFLLTREFLTKQRGY